MLLEGKLEYSSISFVSVLCSAWHSLCYGKFDNMTHNYLNMEFILVPVELLPCIYFGIHISHKCESVSPSYRSHEISVRNVTIIHSTHVSASTTISTTQHSFKILSLLHFIHRMLENLYIYAFMYENYDYCVDTTYTHIRLADVVWKHKLLWNWCCCYSFRSKFWWTTCAISCSPKSNWQDDELSFVLFSNRIREDDNRKLWKNYNET